MHKACFRKRRGFTLAELLIALVILGVIATFTIPKVLQIQRNYAYTSAYKETMGAISQAYQLYIQQNGYNTGMNAADLTPYLNFVAHTTIGSIDADPGGTNNFCNWSGSCLKLHNGATLLDGGNTFGAVNSQNFVSYIFDPDGVYSGTTNGTGKALDIDLYYNGRVNSAMERLGTDTTYVFGIPLHYGASTQPDWFSWS